MMYKTPGEARQALARFTKERCYLIEGETISPAEVWLLNTCYEFLPIKKADQMRAAKRRLVGLARSLGLYPIPAWFEVQLQVTGKSKPKMEMKT